ncbi:MAG TPA: sulfur carrier protein ThiS [Candidatus Kryptonia bacterium]|nr:sulfur carrier protein ThiS [Candidatus Kryptonia bacterium]
MRVTVNGEPRELSDAVSVADLVEQLGLTQRRVAVEINLDIIAREQYASRRLREGDTVEIVQFIGGG